MEAPDYFRNIDPARISRSKAEETLLYVRYLLNREQEPDKIRIYEDLKVILEARLKQLNEEELLPRADRETGTDAAGLGYSPDQGTPGTA